MRETQGHTDQELQVASEKLQILQAKHSKLETENRELRMKSSNLKTESAAYKRQTRTLIWSLTDCGKGVEDMPLSDFWEEHDEPNAGTCNHCQDQRKCITI